MTNNTNLIKLTLTIVATTAVVFNVQAQEDSIKQQSLKNVEVMHARAEERIEAVVYNALGMLVLSRSDVY